MGNFVWPYMCFRLMIKYNCHCVCVRLFICIDIENTPYMLD